MQAGYYHLHVHPISRSKGHHIHAAVAYRHGTLATSMEAAAAYRHAAHHGNGPDAFDYRRKVGVEWVGIIAPDGVPAWMRDPHTLWRAVDHTETRINARLAQEVVIGLPHQVSIDDHIAMLSTFTQTYCVGPYGVVADIAIHAPPVHKGGDPRHWHAHILLTDRPADENGFTRTKDRRTSSKEFVTQLREGWTQIHNTHMERLGLPYRIDHRTLDAQRQDAIQRGDTVAVLDLDRLPQIRLGKAVHTSHPAYEAFAERRARNRAILTANKTRAAAHNDRLEAAIAKADTAAFLESRRNAQERASWQPPPPAFHDLDATYGRTRPTNAIARLKHLALAGEISRKALALSRQHGHPWFASGHRTGAPPLAQLLTPMVKRTGAGHPVFTVTAKDIAFAFYTFGFITLNELQDSLEAITDEERRLKAKRSSDKHPLPSPLPRPKPPVLPTPEAKRLKRLQLAVRVPQAIYRKRLDQLLAFEARQRAHTLRSAKAHITGMHRRRNMGAFPPS